MSSPRTGDSDNRAGRKATAGEPGRAAPAAAQGVGFKAECSGTLWGASSREGHDCHVFEKMSLAAVWGMAAGTSAAGAGPALEGSKGDRDSDGCQGSGVAVS